MNSMKLGKQALALLIPLTLVVSACGSDSKSSDTKATTATTAASAATTATTAASTTAGSTAGSTADTTAATTAGTASSDTGPAAGDQPTTLKGSLNWQTSWTIEQAEAYIKEFNKVYPNIEVSYTRSDDAAFVDKFVAEAKTGKVSEDVVTVGYDGYLKGWDADGYLLHYVSPEGAALPKDYQGADGAYYVNAQLLTGICVNTDVLASKSLPEPKTWEDVASGTYKNSIVMQDMFAIGSGANALYINLKGYWSKDGTDQAGVKRTETFFENLGKQGVVFQPSYTEAQQQLVQGNFAVMPVCYPDYIQPAIDSGAPVKWIAADPVVQVFYGQGITAGAQHPDQAKAFQDFSLSVAGQTALVNIVQQVPTRPGIHYPASAKVAEGLGTYPALGTPWAANENTCCIQAYTDQLKKWFNVS